MKQQFTRTNALSVQPQVLQYLEYTLRSVTSKTPTKGTLNAQLRGVGCSVAPGRAGDCDGRRGSGPGSATAVDTDALPLGAAEAAAEGAVGTGCAFTRVPE